MEASSTPDDLKKKEEDLASVQKEKEAAISAQNFERAAILRDQAKELSGQIEKMKGNGKAVIMSI